MVKRWYGTSILEGSTYCVPVEDILRCRTGSVSGLHCKSKQSNRDIHTYTHIHSHKKTHTHTNTSKPQPCVRIGCTNSTRWSSLPWPAQMRKPPGKWWTAWFPTPKTFTLLWASLTGEGILLFVLHLDFSFRFIKHVIAAEGSVVALRAGSGGGGCGGGEVEMCVRWRDAW
jgi:hypothetical protein